MDERQDFIDRQEARRKELNARIELLRAKVAKAEADARLAMQEEIEALNRQEENLAEKIGELRQAGAASWQDLKSGVEKALEDLKEGLQKAGDRFR